MASVWVVKLSTLTFLPPAQSLDAFVASVCSVVPVSTATVCPQKLLSPVNVALDDFRT